MATFKITTKDSVVSGGAAHAFAGDTAGADTLIVDQGAYLITNDLLARGAFLNSTGTWKVTVNGSIVSTKSDGLLLNNGISGNSSIT